MLQKKRGSYIESFRKNHREDYRVHIRNQLLAHQDTLIDAVNQFQVTQVQRGGVIHQQFGNNSDFDELEETEKTFKIDNIIQNFSYLIKNNNFPTGHEVENSIFLSSLLSDLRRLLFNRADLMKSQFIDECYMYLKNKIKDAISSQKSEDLDLQKQSLLKDYLQIRHHLMETMILVISEHIASEGIFDYSKRNLSWQIREFYQWTDQMKETLSHIVFLERQSESSSKRLLLQKEIEKFHYFLKELNLVVKVCWNHRDQNKEMDFQEIILHLFSLQFFKNLVLLLRSYHILDKAESLITSTLYLAGEFQCFQFFKIMVRSEFLKYCTFQLVFNEEYKTFGSKGKPTESALIQTKIVSNILLILSQICDLCSSNILWAQGICNEVKILIDDISSPRIREDFIKFMLKTVTCLSDLRLIDFANKIDMMDWTMKIIEWRIEKTEANRLTDDIILLYCLESLEKFIQVGEEEKQNNSQLSANPYLIKLKYLRGDEILNQFEMGQTLLDHIFSQERHLQEEL